MILYYSPGACSLADHIALIETGLAHETIRVDLKTKLTAGGESYLAVNPKGYVPALALDDGAVLTENIAILAWIADQTPGSIPDAPHGRYRLLEMLAYISTELHKAFHPLFAPTASDAARMEARAAIEKRLSFLAERLEADYLFGEASSVADGYLFVMLRWAAKNRVTIPARLQLFLERMGARPAVREALAREGLS